MVEIKRYIRFYALAVSLEAHGSGRLQLSCGKYKAGVPPRGTNGKGSLVLDTFGLQYTWSNTL